MKAKQIDRVPRSDEMTAALVADVMQVRERIFREGVACLDSGGQVAFFMRAKLDAFRDATARGKARLALAELVAAVMFIDFHFRQWEKERQTALDRANDVYQGEDAERFARALGSAIGPVAVRDGKLIDPRLEKRRSRLERNDAKKRLTKKRS